MKQKTKLEIIDETVNYYSFAPKVLRGRRGLTCVYRNDDGNMCAVGRCMSKASLNKFANTAGSVYTLVKKALEEPNTHLEDDFIVTAPLKKAYQGHSIEFWQELQALHDCDSNWDRYGITESGIEVANDLRAKWRNR